MSGPIVIAVIAVVATLYPGYLLGRSVQGRPRLYPVVFYGAIVLAVAALAWALINDQAELAGAAIGCGFGLVNGARHGYTQVFKQLRDAADEASAER